MPATRYASFDFAGHAETAKRVRRTQHPRNTSRLEDAPKTHMEALHTACWPRVRFEPDLWTMPPPPSEPPAHHRCRDFLRSLAQWAWLRDPSARWLILRLAPTPGEWVNCSESARDGPNSTGLLCSRRSAELGQIQRRRVQFHLILRICRNLGRTSAPTEQVNLRNCRLAIDLDGGTVSLIATPYKLREWHRLP